MEYFLYVQSLWRYWHRRYNILLLLIWQNCERAIGCLLLLFLVHTVSNSNAAQRLATPILQKIQCTAAMAQPLGSMKMEMRHQSVVIIQPSFLLQLTGRSKWAQTIGYQRLVINKWLPCIEGVPEQPLLFLSGEHENINWLLTDHVQYLEELFLKLRVCRMV